MPEPKGRSGKKPKYQIADIGGADLTSEDISTERVLNFLINGELGAISGKDPANSMDTEVGQVLPPLEPSEPLSKPDSLAESSPSEQPVKKSLSHLFERAGGAAGRESSAFNLETDPPSVPFPVDRRLDQAILQEKVSGSQPTDTGRSIDLASAEPIASGMPPTSVASPAGNPLPASALEPMQETSETWDSRSHLYEQVSRWKTLYRLNSGEIATLQTLFRMADETDSSNCFVKMRNLAELSGLDYRYCQKVVRSLERLGWITKLQEYDAATQLGVLYRINSKPLHLS